MRPEISAVHKAYTRVKRCVVLASAGLFLMACPVAASCLDQGLKLDGAQLRATAPNAPVSAGYLQITNQTGQTQTLISVSAPFARTAELHDMKQEGGVMKMFELDGGLVLPDGLTAALKPMGRHLMFMGLDRQLKQGERFDITLSFAPCGEVTLPFSVMKMSGHKHNQ